MRQECRVKWKIYHPNCSNYQKYADESEHIKNPSAKKNKESLVVWRIWWWWKFRGGETSYIFGRKTKRNIEWKRQGRRKFYNLFPSHTTRNIQRSFITHLSRPRDDKFINFLIFKYFNYFRLVVDEQAPALSQSSGHEWNFHLKRAVN